ncbi:MAG: hypothetical protein ACREQI_07010 [Candidatus Binataceae bacterium]
MTDSQPPLEATAPQTFARGAVPCNRWSGSIAFILYLILSLIIFEPSLWGHFLDAHIGVEPNASGTMAALAWWPYALVHRIDPFYCYAIWAPIGISSAWVTGMPMLSIAIWPVTAAIGVVGAYNVLSLLSPPLAGWGAFLLCRRIAKSWWPALLGGYLFGFSPYMLSEESSGDRHLTVIFLVPLAVLAVARTIDGEMVPRKFVAAMTAILVAEFLISIEIFATMTMFGAMALSLGWLFSGPERARRLIEAALWTSCAYLIAALMLSLNLYSLFVPGVPKGEIWHGAEHVFSGDALKYIIPPLQTAVGTLPLLRTTAASFYPGGIYASSLYIGVPSLMVAAIYIWRERHTSLGKTLSLSFLIVTLCSLGAYPGLLHKQYVSPLGEIILALPLICKALPGRFMMYSFLALGIMASLWFASNSLSAKTNGALGAIVALSMLPNLSFAWAQPAVSPAFIRTGLYRDYLRPEENVLVLPFGHRGSSMLWLAQTRFYFRMVGGWTGPFPPEFAGWPILGAFSDAAYLPDAGEQLGAFMAHFQVEAVVVADSDPEAKTWNRLLSGFSSSAHHAGGMTVFRISPAAVNPYRNVTKLEMQQRAKSSAVDSLIVAAGNWLSSGRSLVQLFPVAALHVGSLKYSWCVGPKAQFFGNKPQSVIGPRGRTFCGVGIEGTPQGTVMIGLFGSYSNLEPSVARYRGAAVHIYFPYPSDLTGLGTPAPPADKWALMVMEFDRERTLEIANQLRGTAPH